MRIALAAAASLFLMAALPHQPATIIVGTANSDSKVYGPGDMLCDLYKCRLFNLPAALGLVPNTIVEFGLPEMNGQDRVDMRRCMEQMCHASVFGYPSERTSPPGHSGPTVFITPVELRLE